MNKMSSETCDMDTVIWLTDPYLFATGRTYTLAKAYIYHAKKNKGIWIQVQDHRPSHSDAIKKYICDMLTEEGVGFVFNDKTGVFKIG